MRFRDRIKELRRVRVSELEPHPLNWRVHPESQRKALKGVLEQIGFANALLVRETDDGRLQLIDGHLRAAVAAEQWAPALVLDVSEEEAAQLLATLDPLAAMAETDVEKLEQLQRNFTINDAAVQKMLADLTNAAAKKDGRPSRPEVELDDSYQVLVACQNESDQQAVYEQMTNAGYACRVLTI